jgi:two-component system chemotaxis response regulator CheB
MVAIEPPPPLCPFDLVTVVGSAGALPCLLKLVKLLPPDFPAALVIVQHRNPQASHILVDVLKRHTTHEVLLAESGVSPLPGKIYVAPASKQLLLDANGAWNLVEPTYALNPNIPCSGDELFESAALTLGPRLIGIVLSGLLSDGTKGIRAIKSAGGRVLVQDPRESKFASQPKSAISTGCVDFVLPGSNLAAALVTLMLPGGAEIFTVSLPSWAQTLSSAN